MSRSGFRTDIRSQRAKSFSLATAGGLPLLPEGWTEVHRTALLGNQDLQEPEGVGRGIVDRDGRSSGHGDEGRIGNLTHTRLCCSL